MLRMQRQGLFSHGQELGFPRECCLRAGCNWTIETGSLCTEQALECSALNFDTLPQTAHVEKDKPSFETKFQNTLLLSISGIDSSTFFNHVQPSFLGFHDLCCLSPYTRPPADAMESCCGALLVAGGCFLASTIGPLRGPTWTLRSGDAEHQCLCSLKPRFRLDFGDSGWWLHFSSRSLPNTNISPIAIH